ncbi:MAG: hypothetical protein RMA76_43835 [Deltaproteobacteria bacterium]
MSRVARAKKVAAQKLRDLIRDERRRARFHIDLIERDGPISRDRVAHIVLSRWVRAAQIEGGATGALGLLGVPLDALVFTYFQLAMIVTVAEAYGEDLDGYGGEDRVLGVLGRAHGVEDVLRASPRVIGAIAKAIALKHGLGSLGRVVPLIAAPISARINERTMLRTGQEALRTFGNVYLLE